MMNPGEDAVARPRWLNWLPVLAREERLSLFENFQASGVWNVDFTIMMGLSSALAACAVGGCFAPGECLSAGILHQTAAF